MTTSARPVFLSGVIVLTLPTGTPEIRTSASSASCPASAKDVWKRYPFGFKGTGPPKASQRKSSSPKHDSANTTIATSLPRDGGSLTISQPPPGVWVELGQISVEPGEFS